LAPFGSECLELYMLNRLLLLSNSEFVFVEYEHLFSLGTA
jgi:hypothetical protein